MEQIKLEFIDHVYMRVVADRSTLQELTDFFSFQPKGYKFSPKYKAGIWDGYIRLMTAFNPYLYVGLLEHIRNFCSVREYELVIDPELGQIEDIPDDYGFKFAKEIGSKLDLYQYQNDYIVNAIRTKRALSLSPTSSGKSFMQYLISQHYHMNYGHRVLIIVPLTSLVSQMAGDFIDYGCNPDAIHRIQGGTAKDSKAFFTISTWQSLQKQEKEWFDQFRVIIGDEAHLFTGKSLTTIMEKCTDAPYKFGFTGTIDSDSNTHKLVLQGVFGQVKRFVSTKDLIDDGKVASFKIKGLVLEHNKEIKKQFKVAVAKLPVNKRYAAEREFIANNTKRNEFIKKLVWSLKDQNNLILFELVEKHGKILQPLLQTEGRQLHFIHGGIDSTERERIRHLVENDPNKNHDILASFGTFSTGTNLKRIDNLIMVSSSKSEIRVLQSIGRTLRIGNGSDEATLYDIADDLSSGSCTNYTLEHFKERVQIYSKEEFPFKIFNIPI